MGGVLVVGGVGVGGHAAEGLEGGVGTPSPPVGVLTPEQGVG